MNTQERFESICDALQASMDRLSGILTYYPELENEESLAILSMMEIVGTALIELGNILELDDTERLEAALDDLAEIQTRCAYIVDRHPVMTALLAD